MPGCLERTEEGVTSPGRANVTHSPNTAADNHSNFSIDRLPGASIQRFALISGNCKGELTLLTQGVSVVHVDLCDLGADTPLTQVGGEGLAR